MALAKVHLVERMVEATRCRCVATRVADPIDALAECALERIGHGCGLRQCRNLCSRDRPGERARAAARSQGGLERIAAHERAPLEALSPPSRAALERTVQLLSEVPVVVGRADLRASYNDICELAPVGVG
jgi:hypothetical protein